MTHASHVHAETGDSDCLAITERGHVPRGATDRSRRRRLRKALVLALAMGAASIGASSAEGATVVRKSASDMTRAETVRFKRAFSYAVRKGYFDVFSEQHFNRERNRQHGVDILATAPPAVALGESPAWGDRLLPWHRSFIIEAERMLRAALRERNRREGRDPREANRLFIPYWDASGDQNLPRWVRAFKPKGGTATVPDGLPPGHAAYGKPVGSRYRVEFGRWPAGNIVFDRLPPSGQVGRIVGQDTFDGFLNALDVVPEIVPSALPAAKLGLDTLRRKVPDSPYLQTVLAAMDPAYPKDPASQAAAFNALLGVGYLATTSAASDAPDHELIAAVKSVYAVFRFPPHIVMHLWAGGLHPDNADVRGTVTYFNELAVDPVFWMLHAELDRYWYSWERSHNEQPPLDGQDAVFQPLTRKEGAWYGGGRRYQLSQLSLRSGLPYHYDKVLRPAASATAALAPPAAVVAPAVRFGCALPLSVVGTDSTAEGTSA